MIGLELLYGIGALALFAAIIYGYLSYKSRDRRNDPVTAAATREQYDHPGRYNAETKDELEKQVR